MLESILKAVRKNGIEEYRIIRRKTENVELYFIKKELDMRRMKDICTYQVTVYRDFEKDGNKMRGMAEVQIYPEMDEETVEKKLADAYHAAAFVCNLYFELPKGTKEEPHVMSGRLPGMSLEETANAFARAIYAADTREDSFINTAEIFVNKENVAIYNSQGIEVSYEKHTVKGEYVVQCLAPQDVELYQDFSFVDYDTEELTRQVAEALETVCARAKATTAPAKGEYNVILSGKQMYQLLTIYKNRALNSYVYAGYSKYKVGTGVQGDDVTGERINMTLKALEPYSEDGIRMKDMKFIEDGVLQAIHGNCRIAYYMGMQPTGIYEGMRVTNGTVSMEEMKKQPYLHVVRFSDFHMDDLSGYFGGEIRLAYLYDGDKVIPVTGGSINGNMLELQKNMTFSTERYKDSRYDGPMAVLFQNVPVAGV